MTQAQIVVMKITLGLVFVATVARAFVPTLPARALLPNMVSSSVQATCSRVMERGERQTLVGRLEASSVGPGLSPATFINLFGGGSKIEIATLPQDPRADQACRKKELQDKQKRYQWSTKGSPMGIPFLEGYPPQEECPHVAWITQVVATILKIFDGALRSTVGATEVVEALLSPEGAKAFVQKLGTIVKGGEEVNKRALELEEFEDMHKVSFKTPESLIDFENDDTFCRHRLQGGNCVVIEKCTPATRAKLKVLDTDPSYKDLKMTIDSLMDTGRLFAVDHDLLKDMESVPLDGTTERFLCPSIALFELMSDDLLPLRPVGIQLSQQHASPIFTPNDGCNWMIAKTCFESADFIIHEMVSHLGHTHLVLEAPVVAMNRQLPKAHPIHALLKPHLEGTSFINWAAQNLLMVPGACVDRLQANSLEDSWGLVSREVLKRISKDFSPPEDLAARRVSVEEFPGRYPYRDFGMKYWQATYTWVQEYLEIYYKMEADIENDYELKAFVDEMVDVGQFKWLAEFYTSSDKRGLIAKVIATLIYTASTLHAAVNFPQKSSMSFIPAVPGSVYAKPPTDKNERTPEEYMTYLPPIEVAKTQVDILTLLGSIFHTKLGDYDATQFPDTRVREPLIKFQKAIEDIEEEILAQNNFLIRTCCDRGRIMKKSLNAGYYTLLPDNIPQSTNI